MVDESLIKDTVREGHLRRVTIRRLLSMIESAEQAGADAVLVTCSSVGEGVEFGQKLFDIPIIRVDEAMARKAVRMGRRIGVMATLRTTLEPTVALLRAKAAEAGVQIDVVESLCDGAFEAVVSGDQATHDRILTAALKNEMKGVDVVVLAQASMAGVLKSLPAGTLSMPVLTSPELGVMAVKDLIEALDGHALVGASANGQKAGR
jgi:Asp/Glu/hydantoin racemase